MNTQIQCKNCQTKKKKKKQNLKRHLSASPEPERTDRQSFNWLYNKIRDSYLHQVFIDPFSEGFLLDSVPFICQKKTKAALGQCFSCRNSNDFEMRGRDRGIAAGARTAGRLLCPRRGTEAAYSGVSVGRGRSRGSEVSLGQRSRSICTATTKYTAFFGGGEQCYSNKSSVDDWDGYSCSWQWQVNPKNVCVPQPRPPCLLILPGGSAGREVGFA